MSYRKLTNLGKTFITTVCKGTGTDKIKGNNGKLIFSSLPSNHTFEAHAKFFNGEDILTNEDVGKALIQWFDFFAGIYQLDANILAAQVFVETSYRLWAYPPESLKSSAQGLGQFLSSSMFDVAIGNFGVSRTVLPTFSEDEINILTNGLVNPREQKAYIYDTNNGFYDDAIANRDKFYQNIIDNPYLSIKAQCRFMKGLSYIAADNAASTLFGYNMGWKYVRSTFTATVDKARKATNYQDGINYVNKVFRALGDKADTTISGKPSGAWFGYKIDFTFDTFTADVKSSGIDEDTINKGTRLSTDYLVGDLLVTSSGRINLPNKTELDKLKIFANKILQRINDEILITKKLTVNSSFRSQYVNSAVGGVTNSQHREGEAGDVRVEGFNKEELWNLYEAIINHNDPKNGKILFDQIIFEEKSSAITSKWIHISYDPENTTRKESSKRLTAKLINGQMDYDPYVAGSIPN